MMDFKSGDKILYIGCDCKEHIRWGNNTDPNNRLVENQVYTVERVEVHSWHTRIYLVEVAGYFNSVWFKLVL